MPKLNDIVLLVVSFGHYLSHFNDMKIKYSKCQGVS
jgi:hypothetical protein